MIWEKKEKKKEKKTDILFKDYKGEWDIPGSTYKIRLVKVEDQWALKLINGKEDHDHMVIPLPNQSLYQIIKSVSFIRQELIRKTEEIKRNQEQNPTTSK